MILNLHFGTEAAIRWCSITVQQQLRKGWDQLLDQARCAATHHSRCFLQRHEAFWTSISKAHLHAIYMRKLMATAFTALSQQSSKVSTDAVRSAFLILALPHAKHPHPLQNILLKIRET